MTSAEVFSYALLLKSGGRASQILNLLEESKREGVKKALESLNNVALDAIRQLWREQRSAEELFEQAVSPRE